MLIVAMSEVSPPLTEYIPHDYRNLVFDWTQCNGRKKKKSKNDENGLK